MSRAQRELARRDAAAASPVETAPSAGTPSSAGTGPSAATPRYDETLAHGGTPAAESPPSAATPGAVRTERRLAGEVGRGALWLSVLTLIASAINYGSNLVFSRLLSPASFGDLTALLGLSVVIVMPIAAAQTRVAERVAAYAAAGEWAVVRYLVRHAFAHLGMIAVAVTFVYLLSVPLVVRLLELRAPGPALALAPLLLLSFLLPVLLGTLQGLSRFVAFGLVSVAIAAARVVFGVPWVLAGGGSGGAIAGQALGMIACLGLLAWMTRRHMERRGSGAASRGLRRRPDVRAVSAGVAFVAFAAMANLDVVLAKLFLEPHESGMYAALATVAKVVTFLPAAVAVTIVPNAAVAEDRRARARVLRLGALLVAGTTLLVAIPAALAPELVIRTMFGAAYLEATPGVIPILIAGAGLSLLYLLAVFAVTVQDRRWTVVLVIGVLTQVIGVWAFHGSPTEVAVVQAVAVAVVLVVNEMLFHPLMRLPRADAA